MPRNLVICCDGTGNEIEQDLSNVLKMYMALERSDRQVVYYDPGIGTNDRSDSWSRVRNQIRGMFRMMTGHGLDANVLDAYRFLVRNYQPGDQVYLFGFSRGAYTARVVAGFVYLIGLLSPEQENLADYALLAYKKAGYSHDDDAKADRRGNLPIAWQVRDSLQTGFVPIRFIGCWDTVASIITPRRDRILIPALQVLPYTRTNPSVQVFRHALAIDERRRMFRVNRWVQEQKVRDRWRREQPEDPEQDVVQMWFAGSHSDVGGGHPEDESGAAKIPLKCMIDEAAAHGVHFHEEMIHKVVDGEGSSFVGPSVEGELHDSTDGMKGLWRPLEWLPKDVRWREWPDRQARLGHYLPRSEPRVIPDNNEIHASVWTREIYSAEKGAYRPENLPQHRRPPSQPLSDAPTSAAASENGTT